MDNYLEEISQGIIDNYILIKEIERKPILYDKSLNSYSNLALKKMAWMQVSEKVYYRHWNNWSKVQKQKSLVDVQKRWHNLRACFLRELRSRKNNSGYKHRRTYVYFKALSFLKAHTYITANKPDTERSINKEAESSNQDEESNVEEDEDENVYENSYDQNQDDVDDHNYVDVKIDEPNISHTDKKESIEIIMPDPLVPRRVEQNIDQDVNFAMSLVPMLTSMPLNAKLDMQIKILKLFQEAVQ